MSKNLWNLAKVLFCLGVVLLAGFWLPADPPGGDVWWLSWEMLVAAVAFLILAYTLPPLPWRLRRRPRPENDTDDD
ncbi:hypothetical protein ACFO4E_20945 [Nocardiopsis mangrovi]|uniref:DUF4175 domain-containing protein n=1 Tax=Nocardiopsis mangrovi TaxID=1179818 RepID=A0ABV9E2W0_9ACTN